MRGAYTYVRARGDVEGCDKWSQLRQEILYKKNIPIMAARTLAVVHLTA
jgi:hypothetical protein